MPGTTRSAAGSLGGGSLGGGSLGGGSLGGGSLGGGSLGGGSLGGGSLGGGSLGGGSLGGGSLGGGSLGGGSLGGGSLGGGSLGGGSLGGGSLGDALGPRWRLEVTSPGVDYPLRGRRAFDRVEGRPVLVHRRVPGDPRDGTGRDGDAAREDATRETTGDGPPGLEQLRGTVRAVEEDAVVLDVPGPRGRPARPVRVPYADIEKATQALPW